MASSPLPRGNVSITLDSLDLPACDFLEADVEGMEVEVVKGATTTVQNYRPLMYIENDRQERSEELLLLLLGLGYSAYWHFAPLFRAANFAGDAEDIFRSIHLVNLLCLPKERALVVQGLRPVSSPTDWFQ